MKHLIIAVTIMVASGFLGRILKFFVRKYAERSHSVLQQRIIAVIQSNVVPLSFVVGFALGIHEIRKPLSSGDVMYQQILDYASMGVYLALFVVLSTTVSRLIKSSIEWYMESGSNKKSELPPAVAPLTMKIINIILFIIAGMIVLDHFGVNIGSILVSLGFLSLGLALASQETMANLISGFVILVDQPFRVGQRIKLSTGEEGTVAHIGMRSTRVVNDDANLLIVPNSELVKNRILNVSLPSAVARLTVEVSVAYGTDLRRAKEILLKLASQQPDALKEPAPQAQLINFSEIGAQFRLVAHVADYRRRFAAEVEIREKIYEAFSGAGIKFAVPERSIRQQSDVRK